jgi:hypothetical protein
MSEKKTATMQLERNPMVRPRTAFFASSFRIVADSQSLGLLEILLQPGVGSFPVCSLVFDFSSFRDNRNTFAKYLAELKGDGDDGSVNEKIQYAPAPFFANMIQCSFTGERTETIFGFSLMHDVANLRHRIESGKNYTLSYDTVVVIYGTIGFQKKLLSEILRLTS